MHLCDPPAAPPSTPPPISPRNPPPLPLSRPDRGPLYAAVPSLDQILGSPGPSSPPGRHASSTPTPPPAARRLASPTTPPPRDPNQERGARPAMKRVVARLAGQIWPGATPAARLGEEKGSALQMDRGRAGAAARRASYGTTTRSRTAASSPTSVTPAGAAVPPPRTRRALAGQGYASLPSSVIASLSCLACVVPAVRGFLVIIFLVSAACLRFAGSLPACCSTSSSFGRRSSPSWRTGHVQRRMSSHWLL